jgi:hypothetical protein
MVKTLQDLRMSLHSRHLAALNMYRFVTSRPFEEAYAVASEQERNIAELIIDTSDKAKLVDWVKKQLREHKLIEVLDVRYLRTLGQEMGVKGYATLTRISLISAIQHLSNGEQKNGHATSPTPRTDTSDLRSAQRNETSVNQGGHQ